MGIDAPDPTLWRDSFGAPPPGTELGPLDEIDDGDAREYRFGRRGAFSMFVVRRGTEVHGYLNVCPHFGNRLNQGSDSFLTDDDRFIRCTSHHSAFRIEDGFGFAGESEGCWLDPVPVVVVDGIIRIGD